MAAVAPSIYCSEGKSSRSIILKFTFVLLNAMFRCVREQPRWFVHLEEEDQQFIKRLVLASSSLKELADHYGVSYPTIRLRLDRVIEKINMLDEIPSQNEFQARVRLLVADGEIAPKLGKELLQLHQSALKGNHK
jgi:hypothetical protein